MLPRPPDASPRTMTMGGVRYRGASQQQKPSQQQSRLTTRVPHRAARTQPSGQRTKAAVDSSSGTDGGGLGGVFS